MVISNWFEKADPRKKMEYVLRNILDSDDYTFKINHALKGTEKEVLIDINCKGRTGWKPSNFFQDTRYHVIGNFNYLLIIDKKKAKKMVEASEPIITDFSEYTFIPKEDCLVNEFFEINKKYGIFLLRKELLIYEVYENKNDKSVRVNFVDLETNKPYKSKLFKKGDETLKQIMEACQVEEAKQLQKKVVIMQDGNYKENADFPQAIVGEFYDDNDPYEWVAKRLGIQPYQIDMQFICKYGFSQSMEFINSCVKTGDFPKAKSK